MKLIKLLLVMAPIAAHAADWKSDHYVDPFTDQEMFSSSVTSVNDDGKEITLTLQCEQITRYMHSYQKEFDNGVWGSSIEDDVDYDALSFGLKFKGIEFIKGEPIKVSWRAVWQPTELDKNGYQPNEYSRLISPHKVDELIYSDVWKQVARSIHDADQIDLKLESPHLQQVWTIDTPVIKQVAEELATPHKCNARKGRTKYLDAKTKHDLQARVDSFEGSFDYLTETAKYSEELVALKAKRELLINPPKDSKSVLSDVEEQIHSLENKLEEIDTLFDEDNARAERNIDELNEMNMNLIETVNRRVKNPQKW